MSKNNINLELFIYSFHYLVFWYKSLQLIFLEYNLQLVILQQI
jgi:hypothetical protein